MMTFREIRWFRSTAFGHAEAKPKEFVLQMLTDGAELRGPLSRQNDPKKKEEEP